MELIIKKECWMIREAMELLFLAANKEEFSENKYLWNLRKFEQELTEELALQKEFLAMAKEIPATPAIRKYFEPFQKEGLECLAKCLIWTFGGETTDSVEEMKALALNEFRQYPLDDFPAFDRIGETLNLKKEERRRFAASVKKLDLEEKFQGRLILAFESYEESLDELGGAAGRGIAASAPVQDADAAAGVTDATGMAGLFCQKKSVGFLRNDGRICGRKPVPGGGNCA